MKLGSFRGALLAVLLGAPPALARTWSSADGSRQIEAELIAVAADQVTLRLANGQQGDYPLKLFSEADQAFTSEWLAKKDEVARVATQEPGALTQELEGKLVKWTGRRFSSYKPEGPPPEYYILYFAASW